MTVEEGHVLNIDGSAAGVGVAATGGGGTTGSIANAAPPPDRSSKYKSGADTGGGGGGGGVAPDCVSVLSNVSQTTSQLEAEAAEARAARDKLPFYKGVTCKDIRDIIPTVLILLGGLLIMIFVIPYAFSRYVVHIITRSESKQRI